MFNIGEYVVCPGHGVGQISNIETKELGEATMSFYIIKIVTNGMTVMVPTSTKDGVRSLATDDDISSVYTLLGDHDVKIDNSTWNRRHREYLAKVKTGSLLEIADVLRQLLLLKDNKKLSFGERKMVDQCKDLLVKEIALTTGGQETEITGKIEDFFEA
jgi:CarD family transcriptional regulator